MNMVVSSIGKDGRGYYTGYLEPEKLNKDGLVHNVEAWEIDVDYKREKSKLITFIWLDGMPQFFHTVRTFNEVIEQQEVERKLKEAGLI